MVQLGLSPLGSALGLARLQSQAVQTFNRDFATKYLCHLGKGTPCFCDSVNASPTGFSCTLNEKLSDILKYLHVSGLSSSL